MNKSRKKLEKVWQEVPVDYYQQSVRKNILQRRWHQGRLKATLDFLKTFKDIHNQKVRLLDVGCASGWFISEICSYYPHLKCSGVDVYQKAIEYAKKSYPHISFFHNDAHHLPFQKNSFDIVICTNVLEHVVNPREVMKEIKRVVKRSGIVIIGMDSENLLFSFVWWLWKKFKGKIWAEAHLHKFRPRDLDKLFRQLGFKIKKKKFINLGMMVVYLLKK